MEKIISLYAEEVAISKRLVNVDGGTIRKRKVTHVKKVDVDNLMEELTGLGAVIYKNVNLKYELDTKAWYKH